MPDKKEQDILDRALSYMKDSVKGYLSKARQESGVGKVVNLLTGDPLTRVMSAFTSLPINAQQMILKLAQLPTSMTEKDLTQSQKLAIYNTIKNAQQRTGKYKRGATEYVDYNMVKDGKDVANIKNKLQQSFTNPEYQMLSTLGRGSYKTKGDSVIYTDKYDFGKTKYKNNTPYRAVRNLMGFLEPSNPTDEQKKDMSIRVALSKSEMEKINKQRNGKG